MGIYREKPQRGYQMEERALVCVTCKQPILVTDEWSWLDGRRREPEHDQCYGERFARRFPDASKARAEERAADDEYFRSGTRYPGQ
jgi:hypothetical protein